MNEIRNEILTGAAFVLMLVLGGIALASAQAQNAPKEPARLPVNTELPHVTKDDAKPEAPPTLTKGAEAEIWRINSQLNELNTELLQLRQRGADLSAKMRDAVARAMKESKIDPEKWEVRITVDQRTQEQVLAVQPRPKSPAPKP